MDGALAVGARVEARFQAAQFGASRTRWFPGYIACEPDATGCCDVQFDDGDFEKKVPAKFIRIPRSLSPASNSPRRTRPSQNIERRIISREPSPACLELHVLVPLIASFESDFGCKRRHRRWDAGPEHSWAFLCRLSVVCSGWQEAVRMFRLDLRTVLSSYFYFRGSTRTDFRTHGLDSAAVHVIARSCPNVRTIRIKCHSILGVSDASVQDLLRACPLLEDLDLRL